MEAWREELYRMINRPIKHSVEGSTWEDHKYIAIVDGKYIYPEDLKSGNSSSSSSTTSTTTGSGSSSGQTVTTTTTSSSGKKISVKITLTDKGEVDSYKDLPEDPAIGDMYTIKNGGVNTKTNKKTTTTTGKVKVYWTGESWQPVTEEDDTKKTTSDDSSDSSDTTTYTSSSKKKTEDSVSKKTVERAKNVVATKKNTRVVKLTTSEAAKSSTTTKGKNFVSSAIKNVANKVVSAVKSSKVYQTGVKLFNKLFGGSSKSGNGGR